MFSSLHPLPTNLFRSCNCIRTRNSVQFYLTPHAMELWVSSGIVAHSIAMGIILWLNRPIDISISPRRFHVISIESLLSLFHFFPPRRLRFIIISPECLFYDLFCSSSCFVNNSGRQTVKENISTHSLITATQFLFDERVAIRDIKANEWAMGKHKLFKWRSWHESVGALASKIEGKLSSKAFASPS